ncbi:hypothetical protein TUM20985_10580 [Mycobacterium antarcticum]|nr:hypothetical protein TUM20985_10580 [Mycolicibacterium sp. TUM20985]
MEDSRLVDGSQGRRASVSEAFRVNRKAAASGIAKTTIYRRYRDRRDVLSQALSRLASPAPLDPRVEPPERLRWLIRHAVETIEGGVGLGAYIAEHARSGSVAAGWNKGCSICSVRRCSPRGAGDEQHGERFVGGWR